MATNFAINGVVTQIAPVTQQWILNRIGTDHNGAPVYSKNQNIILSFDAASITDAREWLNYASGGSSVTLDVLNRWGLEFVTLSSVHLSITQMPVIEAGHAGPFTLTVLGAQPPGN